MKWENGRRSTNVEDRRGSGIRRGAVLGGGGALVVGILALILTGDPSQLLQGLLGGGQGASQGQIEASSPEEDRLADMCAVVLADTEDTWNAIFEKSGMEYKEPSLVIFSGQVSSACGNADSSTGPFYCPGDQKIYIDLSFYKDLASRFRAPGDFAQAYVLAHEVGHHVQEQLGVLGSMHQQMQMSSPAVANDLSVKLELQADFFAGIWAHYADRSRGLLEQGDLEEAIISARH